MDASTTLATLSGANGGSTALLTLGIALALATVVGVALYFSRLKARNTLTQNRLQFEQLAKDLQRNRDELTLALEAAGDGRWDWEMRLATPRLQGALYKDFDLGDLSAPVNTERWTALLHPDDVPVTRATMAAYLQDPRDTFISRFRVRDIQGRWRWIVSRGKAVQFDAQGRVTHMIGFHNDETARREAEIAVREEQAKLSGIFHTLPDGAGSSRISDGCYLEVNPAFERILGFSRDEVVGRASLELGVWAIPSERETLVRECAKHGMVDRLTIHARTKDGRILPGQMSVSSATIGGEKCFVFVFRDLTVEKKVENELMFSKAALDAAGRMGRLGAWVIYFGGVKDDYWSPVCREIVGLTADERVPQDFAARFVMPEHQQRVRDMERRAREQHVGWDIEIEIRRANGQPLWLRIVGEPVVEQGQLQYIRGLMQDVDASHRAVEQLRQSEERFANIFRYLPEAMAIIDQATGRYLDVNPAWETMTGHVHRDVMGKTAIDIGLISRARGQKMHTHWTGVTLPHEEEVEITTRAGDKRITLVSMRAMTVNGVDCWISMHRDITDRRQALARIQEREEQLSLSVSAANLGMWDMNLVTGRVSGNARWQELRGLAGHEMPVTLDVIQAATHADDLPGLMNSMLSQYQVESSSFDVVGRTIWQDGSVHWIRDLGKVVTRDESGRALRMLGLTMDVTDQRTQEDRLQHMAHYDPLTGLPNRVLLGDRMKQAMAHAERTGDLLGVVYLDLDGFKPVNDRLGHSAGDELLRQIAARLPQAMRAADSVARLGGDEFVLLLESLASPHDCILAMQRAMNAICTACEIGGELISVTASMGATLYPQDRSDADTLLRHADQAMYTAKQLGRNRFQFFDAGQEEAARLQASRLAVIRAAFASGEFELHLQPRVNMRTGDIVGAEALARWRHPQRGLLGPAEFLTDIEASDLNIAFGEWVIDTALGILEAWSTGRPTLALSINITARHLQSPNFSSLLAGRLESHPRVHAGRLEIEVTESGSLSDLDMAVNVINRLRAIGVHVSLDDFGTGYSSLTYLRRLPVNTLKIDQSFVRDMLNDPDDRAIVKGVIGLAHSFGREVVAEGVETAEQGALLLEMGCDMAQGYGIARPMPESEMSAWLAHWQANALWSTPVAT